MQTIGLTTEIKKHYQLRIKKLLQLPLVTFLVLTILPFIMYFAAFGGMLDSWTNGSTGELEAAVAKITVSSGLGTGFLVSSTKVITARHVVEGEPQGTEVNLVFEQVEPPITRTATIEWIAPTSHPVNSDGTAPLEYFLSDVAILKLNDPINEIKPLYLGDSELVKNLDGIILVGYPSGDYSISEGNINNTQYQELKLFKLDATSNPGNSGGPAILKSDNTIIGILVGGPSNPLIDGENIALKINDALDLMAKDGISLDDLP